MHCNYFVIFISSLIPLAAWAEVTSSMEMYWENICWSDGKHWVLFTLLFPPYLLNKQPRRLNDFGSLWGGTELLLSPSGIPHDEMTEKLLDDTKESPLRSSHPGKTADANQELTEDIQVVRWDKTKEVSHNAEFSPVTTVRLRLLC